ncbi:hypothetical protein ACNUDM_05090 [Vibrio chaetopteri]|uniref:hypothetical protein n=1 Tax=Vibrio chaetopteri TaxID=3016528 RepID=UPI003AB3EB78
MKYSEMSKARLREIIEADTIRVNRCQSKYSSSSLALCLKAKINYLLTLLGEDIKYKSKDVLIKMEEAYGFKYQGSLFGIGGNNPNAEDNLSGWQDVDETWVEGHWRNGSWVEGHWRRAHTRYR